MAYKTFLISLGKVLPCSYCRDSYNDFISNGENMLKDEDLENRDALTVWMFKLHNRVNNKLGMDYGMKYGDIAKRYESFRAKCTKKSDPKVKGCVAALDWRAKSYHIDKIKDCPVVPAEIVMKFVPYAKSRGIDTNFVETYKDNLIKFLDNKEDPIWMKRNEECAAIIDNMRMNSIPCLEIEKPFEGLPTKDELELLMRMSTNICINELHNIIDNKLPKSFSQSGGGIRKYKLTSK
jgi:hypothetical protein